MNIDDLRIGIEVLSLIVFLAIVWWAYNPRRRATLDQVARSVLDD